ncbi:MAG TPA: hypothetical protein PKG93_03375 [Bacilli bacterium]|jgi:hypothetical protein|nr:hypothetical protein [Bacilli bacterium]
MMTIVKSKKNIRVLVGSLLMSFMLTGCSSEDILVQHSMIPTSIETVYENDDVININDLADDYAYVFYYEKNNNYYWDIKFIKAVDCSNRETFGFSGKTYYDLLGGGLYCIAPDTSEFSKIDDYNYKNYKDRNKLKLDNIKDIIEEYKDNELFKDGISGNTITRKTLGLLYCIYSANEYSKLKVYMSEVEDDNNTLQRN